MRWRYLVWLAVVATAVALDQRESAKLQDPQGRQTLDAKAVLYDKLPGLSFNEQTQSVSAESLVDCRRTCDQRGKECQSFSFHDGSKECMVSPSSMLFDPDAALSIRTQTGEYYEVPGLSYFHDHQGEWLHTSITTSGQCEKLCNKANNCKAFKFQTSQSRCSLTGKEIIFGPQWTYFSKHEEESAPAPPPQSDATAVAQHEINELASQIQDEKAKLQEENTAITKAKVEAKSELEQAADDSDTIAIMKQRLAQAKEAAKQQVEDALSEKKLEKDANAVRRNSAKEQENLRHAQEKHDQVLNAETAKTKEDADKEIRSVKAHIEKVEEQARTDEKQRAMFAEVKQIQQNATHLADRAEQQSRELAQARANLKIKEKGAANELASKRWKDKELIKTEELDAQLAVREAQKRNKIATKELVDTVGTKIDADTEVKVAKATAAEKNTAAQNEAKWQRIRAQSTRLKGQVSHWEASLEAEENKVHMLGEELETENLKVTEFKEALKDRNHENPEAAAAAKKDLDAQDKKLIAAMEKAKKEAAAAEAKAKADSDMHVAFAEKAKEQALADERASKESARQAKIDKMKAEQRHLEKIKEDYQTAVKTSREVAKDQLAQVKAAAQKASEVSDPNAASKMLEAAKQHYRDKVQQALDTAARLKAEIPAGEERPSLYMHPAEVAELVTTAGPAEGSDEKENKSNKIIKKKIIKKKIIKRIPKKKIIKKRIIKRIPKKKIIEKNN